jgi:hypothetical protein
MCARRALGEMGLLNETASDQERNLDHIDSRLCTKVTIGASSTVKPSDGEQRCRHARLRLSHKPYGRTQDAIM